MWCDCVRPTNVPLCLSGGGYINEASEAEARARGAPPPPPPPPRSPGSPRSPAHRHADFDFKSNMINR